MACVINYNNKIYSLEDFKNILLKDASLVKEVANKSQEKLKAIQEIFNSNPELSKVGDVFSYAIYLDTIFPDSKVKDIVYHFSNTNIEIPDKNKFSLSANINRRKGFFGISKNINPGNNFANVEGTIPHAMLFNMKNPDNGDFSVIPPIVAKDNSKDSAIIKQRGGINYYAVFEPEQIHILGSKQDIEGFSNWVESGLQPTIDLQSIGVTQQEWSTLTQEEKEMIKQQNTICK